MTQRVTLVPLTTGINSILLENGENVIGRSALTNISSQEVSRKHFTIQYSLNPTHTCSFEYFGRGGHMYINSKLVKKGEKHILENGDVLKLLPSSNQQIQVKERKRKIEMTY